MDVRIFVLLFIFGIVGSITASPSPSNSNYYRRNPSLSESLELSTSSTTTESQSTSITTSTVTPTTITPTTITPTTVTPTTVTPTTVSVTPTPLSVSTSTETVTKPYATTTTDISTNKPQSVSKSDPSPKFESNENKPEKSNNNEKCQQSDPTQPNTNCFDNTLYNPIRKPQFDPYAYCRDIWNQYQNPYRRFPSSNFWPQSPYGNPRIPTYGQQYPQFRHTMPYFNYYNPLPDYRNRNYNIELNNHYPIHGSAGNTPFGIGRNINAMFQEPEETLQTRMNPDYSQFDQLNPVFPQINRDVPTPR